MKRIVATITDADYGSLREQRGAVHIAVTIYEWSDAPPVTIEDVALALGRALHDTDVDRMVHRPTNDATPGWRAVTALADRFKEIDPNFDLPRFLALVADAKARTAA